MVLVLLVVVAGGAAVVDSGGAVLVVLAAGVVVAGAGGAGSASPEHAAASTATISETRSDGRLAIAADGIGGHRQNRASVHSLPVPVRTLATAAALLVACGGSPAATPAPGASPPSATSAPPTTMARAPTTTTLLPSAEPATSLPRAATSQPATTLPSPAITAPPATLPPLAGLALAPVAAGLFQPTAIAVAPGDDALYVAERDGRIVRIQPGAEPVEFLDLTAVTQSSGIEQGLLGLAFHPDDPGRLFTYRTVGDGTASRRLSEWTAGEERIHFELSQPGDEPRHYAGMLEFGPDGRLWISSGDGTEIAEGQDAASPYAALLRYDVDGTAEPAVWGYGLRNPWRFAIDVPASLVYVADVGLEQQEEVNVAPLAAALPNFGWPVTEGDRCFRPRDCDPAGITLPVLTYGHDEGCSITGGRVYRGAAIPELDGHYFYADWCGQWVRSFRYAGGEATDLRDWSAELPAAGQVTTFGAGPDGELYLANFAGEVWRIAPVR